MSVDVALQVLELPKFLHVVVDIKRCILGKTQLQIDSFW